MNTSGLVVNDFLQQLLPLQQDGHAAISAPTNWTTSRPLLHVRTQIDDVIESLADSCLALNGNGTAKWCFFVGSPGNGKSAAVGSLAKLLLDQHHCSILAQDGTPMEDLPDHQVPYQLDVFEPGNSFPTARIVQDASVVRNPYATTVDPAADLITTLSECWQRGISLIVCTNRGVLEKAFRDTHLDPQINHTVWFRKVLKPVSEHLSTQPFDASPFPVSDPRGPFQVIGAQAIYLDTRSLVLNSDTFAHVLEQAVLEDRWLPCAECPAKPLCPFLANRSWLATPEGKAQLVDLLRRAEVLSSQVIVFREALALVSFFLAGCARDYGSQHPCEWVHAKAGAGDIFNLSTRRLHMCLYCSACPSGLEANGKLSSRQRDGLSLVRGQLDALSPEAAALRGVLDSSSPSTDAGVTRLLGRDGVLSQLDPIFGPLPSAFFDAWDGSYDTFLTSSQVYIADLDRACVRAWGALEQAVECLETHDAANAYWSIRRWSSQYMMRAGVMVESRTRHSQEIDRFTELLNLLAVPATERSRIQKVRLRELQEQIQTLLVRASEKGHTSGVVLSPTVAVDGDWVTTELKPHVEATQASGSLTLGVTFGPDKQGCQLTAAVYLWIQQRVAGDIDARCMPADVLSDAIDARSRALARSPYAFTPDGITLRINGDHGRFTITRIDGDCDVASPD
jgi:hypothetical protein